MRAEEESTLKIFQCCCKPFVLLFCIEIILHHSISHTWRASINCWNSFEQLNVLRHIPPKNLGLSCDSSHTSHFACIISNHSFCFGVVNVSLKNSHLFSNSLNAIGTQTHTWNARTNPSSFKLLCAFLATCQGHCTWATQLNYFAHRRIDIVFLAFKDDLNVFNNHLYILKVSSNNMTQANITLVGWLLEPTNNIRGLSYILVLYVMSNMRMSPKAT